MLTGHESKWPDRRQPPGAIKDWVRNALIGYDPTGQKGKYVAFIAKQMAMGPDNIVLKIGNEEDGDRIRRAIAWFIKESEKGSWGTLVSRYYDQASNLDPTTARAKFTNIFNFRSWRDIEYIMTETETARAADTPRESEAESESYKLVYELTVGPDKFRAYEILEPEAFVELGGGDKNLSTWCTSYISRSDQWDFKYPDWHPKAGTSRKIKPARDPHGAPTDPQGKPTIYPTSKSIDYWKDKHWVVYLSEDDGPFKPLWQFGGKSFMVNNDRPPTNIGINEDYFLGKWAQERESDAPLDSIYNIRQRWRPNPDFTPAKRRAIEQKYLPVRPPLIQPKSS